MRVSQEAAGHGNSEVRDDVPMRALRPLTCLPLLTAVAAQHAPPFHVHAVDGATGRGVPLVELTTVHGVTFVTDSAGIAVVDEPELAGRRVWLSVRSHGYRFPADAFGFRGVRVAVERGGSETVRLERTNIAERLYRVTGAGIYRDSVLVGRDLPIARPLANGGVFGQDSVVNAVYRGRLYWFWGDTNRAGHPLGNFAVSGATSKLPERGGLDPALGVDLDYFVGDDGFVRAMCPIDGPGAVWIDGVCVVDDGGREVMLCHYARMQDLGTRHEHGIARWNDDRERFEKLVELPRASAIHPSGHATHATLDGADWLLFCHPFPLLRVRPRLDDALAPERYEAFTCLVAGARFDAAEPALDRGADGAIRWGWKPDTDAVSAAQWRELVREGHVTADAARVHLTDVETGNAVRPHGGSLCWNPFVGKWIAIVLEAFGRSPLGEVWYAEADSPTGPWRRARRIVTHDRYSFYNVTQHPCFDAEGGRYVYFEGTYTKAFSGSEHATPRYDYNQIMYRLDLADERLRSGGDRDGESTGR